VSLYGGIQVADDIDIPTLGIHVSSKMETGDFVFRASFCYDCQVVTKSKDIIGFWDAINRLEIFLNSCSVASSFLGGSPTKGAGTSIHYYCQFLFDGGTTGLVINEYIDTVNILLNKLHNCPPEQHQTLLRECFLSSLKPC
jgi:hypothetical protein